MPRKMFSFAFEVATMRLKLAEKDLAIKSLHDRLERGEAAEHIKHMQQELDMCMREKEVERNARIQLEKNLEQLNTTFILLRQSKFNTRDDMVLVQVSPWCHCGNFIFLLIEGTPPRDKPSDPFERRTEESQEKH